MYYENFFFRFNKKNQKLSVVHIYICNDAPRSVCMCIYVDCAMHIYIFFSVFWLCYVICLPFFVVYFSSINVFFFFSSKISPKLYRYGFLAFIRKFFMNSKFFSQVFFKSLISINRDRSKNVAKETHFSIGAI